MPRLKRTLKKQSENKINDFFNKYADTLNAEIYVEEYENIKNIIVSDVLKIKDCEEDDIVDFYIDEFINQKYLDKISSISKTEKETLINDIKKQVRHRLVNKYVIDEHFDNNIDAYFNAVKRESILYPMGESFEIDFLPENKEIFIKNNLKLVINTAKKYRNLGLDFDDLIQIGNEGLLKAWDKFDIERSSLKKKILTSIEKLPEHEITKEEAVSLVSNSFSYSKLLGKTLDKIPEHGFKSKNDFTKWTKSNIKTATFTSVGFIWIRSMIVNELSKYSNIIRVPNSIKNVSTKKSLFINIDSINPYTEDNYADAQLSGLSNNEFQKEENKINNNIANSFLSEFITKLLGSLESQERRIIIKRFGIGQPFNMTISEIAENEGLSINSVNEILNNAIKKMKSFVPKDKLNMIYEFIEDDV